MLTGWKIAETRAQVSNRNRLPAGLSEAATEFPQSQDLLLPEQEAFAAS